MKYDSVLDQQSISGKIVSLILCVWKPCYVKSGHIYIFVPIISETHPIIQEYSPILSTTYYSRNYAGIIDTCLAM